MLLLFHVLTCLLKHRIKPTDLIIGHVALIHIILLLPTGFIATDIFGSQDSGDDIKHKSVMYMYRLMRGLSISTTCLLSVLPAITWLMALSSGYMVILLSRHNRQSQHFHSTNLSPKAPPEKMATQTILLLVSCFVNVYILDCVVTSSGLVWNIDPVRH
ncbi:hypothetical protein H8958_002458 [Nasalis larvatus]